MPPPLRKQANLLMILMLMGVGYTHQQREENTDAALLMLIVSMAAYWLPGETVRKAPIEVYEKID